MDDRFQYQDRLERAFFGGMGVNIICLLLVVDFGFGAYPPLPGRREKFLKEVLVDPPLVFVTAFLYMALFGCVWVCIRALAKPFTHHTHIRQHLVATFALTIAYMVVFLAHFCTVLS